MENKDFGLQSSGAGKETIVKVKDLYRELAIEEVKKLKEKGTSCKEIATMYKVTQRTIRNWLK